MGSWEGFSILFFLAPCDSNNCWPPIYKNLTLKRALYLLCLELLQLWFVFSESCFRGCCHPMPTPHHSSSSHRFFIHWLPVLVALWMWWLQFGLGLLHWTLLSGVFWLQVHCCLDFGRLPLFLRSLSHIPGWLQQEWTSWPGLQEAAMDL